MTFGVVILILLITYRSPVLWMLPIFCAVVANTMAGGVVYLLAKYAGLVVNDQSQYILSILVIGAGTDYALLLVARYREELRRHEDRHEAMAFALHRAAPGDHRQRRDRRGGPAVPVLRRPQLHRRAWVRSWPSAWRVTLLVMVTLLPGAAGDLRSLDVLAGAARLRLRRAHPDRLLVAGRQPDRACGRAPCGSVTAVHPGGRLPRACSSSTPTACPPRTASPRRSTRSRRQKLLADHDLADSSNTDPGGDQRRAADGGRRRRSQDIDGLGSPPTPSRSATVAATSRSRSSTTWPPSRPSTSSIDGARRGARRRRCRRPGRRWGGVLPRHQDRVAPRQQGGHPAGAPGGPADPGAAAAGARVAADPDRHRDPVLRCRARASRRWSSTYVFDFAGADAGFPLFAFVFLVALGVDYNIFLMTRVREETAQHGTRRGSLIALSSTGGVITSAGLVLAATFLVLATLPFVFLVELGTAVALGVLLDTLIVRSVLVTAINLDLGGKIWWPSTARPGRARRSTRAARSPSGESVTGLSRADQWRGPARIRSGPRAVSLNRGVPTRPPPSRYGARWRAPSAVRRSTSTRRPCCSRPPARTSTGSARRGRAGARRRAGRGRPAGRGHLLAQGLHPGHQAVPRPVPLLHVRGVARAS